MKRILLATAAVFAFGIPSKAADTKKEGLIFGRAQTEACVGLKAFDVPKVESTDTHYTLSFPGGMRIIKEGAIPSLFSRDIEKGSYSRMYLLKDDVSVAALLVRGEKGLILKTEKKPDGGIIAVENPRKEQFEFGEYKSGLAEKIRVMLGDKNEAFVYHAADGDKQAYGNKMLTVYLRFFLENNRVKYMFIDAATGELLGLENEYHDVWTMAKIYSDGSSEYLILK